MRASLAFLVMLKRLTPYVPWLALIVATTALFTDAKDLRTFVRANAHAFPAWFLVGAGYTFLGFAFLSALYWVLVLPVWWAQFLAFVFGLLPVAALSWAVIGYSPRHRNDYAGLPSFLHARPHPVYVQFVGVLGLLLLLWLFIASERDRRFRHWRE